MASETPQYSAPLNEADEKPQAAPGLDEAAVNEIVGMINLMASARDAMSDEMVARIARTATEGMAMLDRLTRNEGLMRLVQVLDRPDCQCLLVGLADALTATSRDIANGEPAKGGVGGLMRLAREPGTQEGVRLVSLLGKHLSDSMREQQRRGG